jgi:hypothetical protein
MERDMANQTEELEEIIADCIIASKNIEREQTISYTDKFLQEVRLMKDVSKRIEQFFEKYPQ